MSRTKKRFPVHSYYRCPRGARQAKRAGLRSSKVPPDSYDDKGFDKQCFKPYRIGERLAEKGWPYERIEQYMKKKFGLRLSDARSIAEMADTHRARIPRGCMAVYNERKENGSQEGAEDSCWR